MHTPGAQVLKSVHPAAKMCTQGAPLISNTGCLWPYGINNTDCDFFLPFNFTPGLDLDATQPRQFFSSVAQEIEDVLQPPPPPFTPSPFFLIKKEERFKT